MSDMPSWSCTLLAYCTVGAGVCTPLIFAGVVRHTALRAVLLLLLLHLLSGKGSGLNRGCG